MRRSSSVSLRTVCCREAEPADRLFRVGGHLAPQNIKLDIHAQQGLQDAVVNFAGDAAALPLDGMGPDVAKQEQILQGLPKMPDDPFQPLQILGKKPATPVSQA